MDPMIGKQLADAQVEVVRLNDKVTALSYLSCFNYRLLFHNSYCSI